MILIAPYSKKMPNQLSNAKEYPYWERLLKLIDGKIVQIGIKGEKKLASDFSENLPLKKIEELVKECEYWISIDSFLPHLAHHIGKPGVVIWSMSDPEIFGYKENLNILKDRKYLREKQFELWNEVAANPDAFLEPEKAIDLINQWKTEKSGKAASDKDKFKV